MAADGNDNNQPDVQRAVQAGTDLSHGSGPAYENLQREVEAARTKYGDGTPGFNQFGQAVADGLKQTGALEEMSEQWARHALNDPRERGDVAHTDEKHIRQADLNPVFGHNALEQAYLTSLQQHYGDLQQRAGETFAGNPRNHFGVKELDHVLASRQHERDVAENQRLAQDAGTREQAKLARITQDLFANDGNPDHSLYKVLDGIKSGDGRTDEKISRGDLKRYEQDYAARAGHVPPDFGFTPENLEAVRTLQREWDKPLGLALRGQDPDTNGYINLEAASQAAHVAVDQLYTAFGPQAATARTSNVDGDGQLTPGPAAQPAVEAPASGPIQYDKDGNPIGGNPAGNPGDAPAPVAPAPAALPTQFDKDGNPIGGNPGANPGDVPAAPAPAAPGAGPQQYDGNGNPVGAGPAANPGDGTAPAPIPRAVGPDGRPVPLPAEASPAPAPAGTPTASAYDDYYGPSPAATPGAPAQPGAPAAPADRRPAAAPADASPAAGAVPDIDHAPPLALPDIKPGDDPAKIAAAFQQAAIAHFTADAIYTVKPGQGWDRVARDTMRKSDEDISSETKVENYSNSIAKLNGLSGRLDTSHVLQPGEQVQVRDAAWVQDKVNLAMQILAKKITDQTKASAAPAAPAPGDGPDLYPDSRNGGGDIVPPAAAAAPAPAAPEASVAAPPAPAAPDASLATPPAPAAPEASVATPPAPGADVTAGGPVPIPVGADGQPLPPAQPVVPGGPVDPNAQAAVVGGNDGRKDTPAPAAPVASNDDVPDIYNANPLGSA